MATTPSISDWMIHPFSGAVGAIILSAAVRALPEPGTTGTNPFSAVYAWFYRFMNGILANFDRSNPASFPHTAQPQTPLSSLPDSPLPLYSEAGTDPA